MDFFEHQQQARRHTALMVLLFFLAVVAIVAALDVIGALVYALTTGMRVGSLADIFVKTPRSVHLGTAGVTLAVIAFGSALRMYDLSSGGVAVAEMVGARRVKRDSQDLPERRLLNIVEEMALASGIAVPLVYVMDDQRSINAFAAGYSPNEAVVTVTRGALENLNRDELQGVIGHEFSHILNGDMRLNIRLMGVIAGIVMIGGLGRFFMNLGRGGEGGKGGDPRPILLGLALWVVGSIGVFFGRLIKATISRQREFLADASAVQFTRNPEGIGGALYKIDAQGSLVMQRHSEELSHMYFGESVANMFDLLNAHPPVEERIERIMGQGAKYLLRDRAKRAAANAPATAEEESPLVAEFVSPLIAPRAAAGLAGPRAAAWGRAGSDTVRTTAQAVVASVGKLQEGQVDFARRVLDAIPAPMRAALGAEDGAKAVLFALLLSEGETRAAQLRMIGNETIAGQAEQFAGMLRKLDPRARLPLLDLVIATLKVLPESEREGLMATVKGLIEADRKVTIGEFVLLILCKRHFGKETTGAPPVKHKTIEAVAPQARLLLSLLAHAGGSGDPALHKGMTALGLPGGTLVERSALNIAAAEGALYELKLLAPLKKPIVIKACLEVVMADGKLTVAEGELMRAICAALDSPLPPLLETAEVAQ